MNKRAALKATLDITYELIEYLIGMYAFSYIFLGIPDWRVFFSNPLDTFFFLVFVAITVCWGITGWKDKYKEHIDEHREESGNEVSQHR